MPPGAIIPELAYPDVDAAAGWLIAAFGFRERVRIGAHRIQLTLNGESIVVMQGDAPAGGDRVMLRVDDVNAAWSRAMAAGGRVVNPPADYPFGERQCTVADPHGRQWVLSQSIADVDARDWGGVVPEL